MKIGMISIYPPKGLKHAKLGGVASYTKNLTDSLNSLENANVTVFANKIGNKEDYVEKNTRVIRCWDKGSSYIFQIFWNSFKYRNEIDIFHIQHEYFLYGRSLSAILFPVMLLLLKLLRKPIIMTFHGVIPLSKLNQKFMKQNFMGGNPVVLKFGLFTVTNLICWFSDTIIAHEDYFKNILVKDYGINNEGISVIYHGIEKIKSLISKKKAKKILGVDNKRVLLFFGYLTGYKRIEVLIKAFQNLKNTKYILFVAGGKHPRAKEDSKYEKYLRDLEEKAKQVSDEIIFTGFVPESDINLYFSAADLVIFPYSFATCIGPMSFVISYKGHFLVSRTLKIAYNFPKELMFETPADLTLKIKNSFSSPTFKKICNNLISDMEKNKTWRKIGYKTNELYKRLMKRRGGRTNRLVK